VENNARVRWCPGAGCGRAVERSGGGGAAGVPEDVACAVPPAGCGAVFCWSCGAEAHRPLACATVRAWLLKNSAESENMTWCANAAALALAARSADGRPCFNAAEQDLGAHEAVSQVHAAD
jgi:ariadne-1